MELNIKVRTLKEEIASTIGKDLQDYGFKIDSTLTWVTKIVNKKNKIRFFIDCYNYPLKLEFALVIQTMINEIEKEREQYCKYANLYYQKNYTLIFSEGYFHPATKNLEHNYKTAFTHIVSDLVMIEKEIADCRKVLNDEIIPMLPTFSILENFQEYVLKNYKKIGDSTFTIPSIFAMKLKGNEELKMITEHFWNALQLEQKPTDHLLRKFIENILLYSRI